MTTTPATVAPPASPRVHAGRGPFTRWPRAADAVLAAVVATFDLLVVDRPDGDLAWRLPGDIPPVALVALVVAGAALVVRRSRPTPVLALTLVAWAVSLATGAGSVLAVIFALYAVGRYEADERRSALGLGATLVLGVTDGLVDGEALVGVGFGAAVQVGVWSVGRRLRARHLRAAQLERQRRAEAQRVVAAERARIARELHDVVAHRVSLMTVQAGAAKTVAGTDLDGALRAMEAVEQAGREALDELRHLLDVLRPDPSGDGLGPQPGLADVPRLVEQLTDAGLDVTLHLDPAAVDVPARVDLSAFRIVQEALTNVLKHAGPDARARVRIAGAGGGVTIEVLDDGRGTGAAPGTGHGIVGMRERAALLGGSLEAGPRPTGGFRVSAHLPAPGGAP